MIRDFITPQMRMSLIDEMDRITKKHLVISAVIMTSLVMWGFL